MIAAVASLALVTIAFRCFWLWQPERQLLLHQAHFREAVERRDWGKVEALMDPAYSDRWGYTRSTGVREARQWMGQFFALTVNVEPAGDQFNASGGTVVERWRIDGNGTELATMVQERVDSIRGSLCVPMEARKLEAMGLDAHPRG